MAGSAVKLPDLKSADIADAAEKLTGRRCHMSSAIRLIEGGALAGPALTLQLVRDESTPAMALGLEVVRAIEAAPASTILVMALEDGADFAAFGATLGLLMKVRQLGGLVVDGSVRDRLELRRIQLPTFARGLAAGSAGGHYRLASVNAPLICGGVEVHPGDLVVGDEDGVAVAPKARQDEALVIANKLQADEGELLKRIEAAGSYLK
ncbi:MAG: RraA family protein, partial [Pyrinomonadaceae bacterium]